MSIPTRNRSITKSTSKHVDELVVVAVNPHPRLTRVLFRTSMILLASYGLSILLLQRWNDIGNKVDFIVCALILGIFSFLVLTAKWSNPGWFFIGLALVSWSIGMAIKSIFYHYGLPITSPNIADIFLMGRALLATYGLYRLLGFWAAEKVPQSITLNGLTVGLATCTVGMYFTNKLLMGTESSFGLTIMLTYLIFSVGIIGFSIGVFVILAEKSNMMLLAGNLGVCFFTAMDAIQFYRYINGNYMPSVGLVFGWIFSLAIVTIASNGSVPKYYLRWNNNAVAIFFPLLSLGSVVAILFLGDTEIPTKILAALTVLTSAVRTIEAHQSVSHEVHARDVLAVEMEKRAITDPLTNLPNRRGLYEVLEKTLSQPHSETSLLLMDLDHFKAVNDTLGHEYGDKLLIGVSQRLASFASDNIFPGRLGGDEFAVVLKETSSLQALRIGKLVHDYLVSSSILVDGITPLQVEASIGVSTLQKDESDYSLFLARADSAMYAAKRSGQRVVMWDESMVKDDIKKLEIAGELRQAITNDELELYYQPQMSIDGKTLTGVEALIRWNHPVHGLVPPDDFIPHAESTALIHPLTDFVLDAAVRQAAQWNQDGMPLKVSINLSGRSLGDMSIISTIAKVLTQYNCPAGLLDVEVTESAIMDDTIISAKVLTALKDLGVGISLDDFGSGNTSLAYLREFPWDTLKIDKSLTKNVTDSSPEKLILEMIIDLGFRLEYSIIVEGVEDKEMLSILSSISPDIIIQGYIFSCGLTRPALMKWIKELNS